MAKFVLINVFLLSLATGGLTINIRDIFGFGYPRLIQPEKRQSVEVIRWRQPVCITAAPGVLPCLVGLTDNQRPVQTGEENVAYDPDHLIDLIDIKSKPVKDDLKTSWSKHDNDLDDVSLESLETDVSHLTKRSAPKLYSPRVVRYVKLEDMGESTLENPAALHSARGGRYLRLAPQMGRATYRNPTYDVKVVDSPVIANLVAETCLPDIGIPLCSELGVSPPIPILPIPSPPIPVLPPSPLPSVPLPSKPLISLPGLPSLPSLPSILPLPSLPNVSSQVTVNISNSVGSLTPQQLPGQAVIQSIADFLNRPTIVQTNGDPEIKPVIVVQPTSSPGILAGINAFLAPNGNNWFNLSGNPLIGLVNLSALPGFSPLPGIPSFQDILQRPENEISGPAGLLGILGIPNNQKPPPSVGPPTEKPGIFGGIFSSPSRPTGLENATTTAPPTLLGGIGNIFNQPTNRPLVIERPDEKPLVVQRPVYVVEQPVTQGLLDIFQNPNRPIVINSTKEPEVIKDPTYVLQRPTENPLTGLLGNWNIFNRPSTQPPPPPVVIIDREPSPGLPTVIINKPPQNHSPNIMPTNPQLPPFPVKPGLVSSSSSSISSSSSTSIGQGISNAFSASSASSVVNPLGPSSTSSLSISSASSTAKKGSDSTKPVDAVPETNLDSENNGLREGSELEAPVRGVLEETKVQELKEKILLEEQQAVESDKFKDIDAVPIDEQVHNEA